MDRDSEAKLTRDTKVAVSQITNAKKELEDRSHEARSRDLSGRYLGTEAARSYKNHREHSQYSAIYKWATSSPMVIYYRCLTTWSDPAP